MRESTKTDFNLIIRIYRRLHDMQFQEQIFSSEALVYLPEPSPSRWRKAHELVWKDAGPVFDEYFGYLELSYADHDLHGFFTQKLQVPENPDVTKFADVWARLSEQENATSNIVEKRLKRVIEHLMPLQKTLTDSAWWSNNRHRLRVWTNKSKFVEPLIVYAPDDGAAMEIFADSAPIAWNPTQAHQFVPFIKTLGCRSLGSAVQARFVGPSDHQPAANHIVLTSAAKELIVCLVCNAPKWRERQSLLERLLVTTEVIVAEVLVEYSLNDNPDLPPITQERDAFWHTDLKELTLKGNAEPDAWRSSTADSLASALAGVMPRGELTDTIYRLLTASPETAKRILREKSWSLSKDQDEWLTSLNWKRVTIERRAEEVEPQRPQKQTQSTGGQPDTKTTGQTTQTPPPKTAPQPQQPEKGAASTSGGTPSDPQKPKSTEAGTAATGQPSPPAAPNQAAQGNASSTTTSSEPSRIRLKQPGKDKVELRVARPRPPRRRRERTATEQTQRNAQTEQSQVRSGLESLTQAEKSELETRGREYAAQTLRDLGYRVTLMGERSPGYDILAEKESEALEVEVKAHLRKATKVFLPKGEWKAYLRTKNQTNRRWELWNIEYLSEDAGRSVEITRYSEIPTDAIEESGFWVDLSACS
jgi:hypothetical protein